MTALRFQTRGRHQTSLASLRGGEREGGKGREREKKEREGGRGKEAEAGRQTHMFIKLGAMHTLELSKLLSHELQ